MQSNSIDEEQNQKTADKKSDDFYKYLIGLAFVFAISTLMNPFIGYETLDTQTYLTFAILFIIPLSLTIITMLFWGISLIYQLVKRKSLTKADIKITAKEQIARIKNGYKIVRIIMWVFYGSTIITLMVYIIYKIILIFNNL